MTISSRSPGYGTSLTQAPFMQSLNSRERSDVMRCSCLPCKRSNVATEVTE
jgi:hypothetical protein